MKPTGSTLLVILGVLLFLSGIGQAVRAGSGAVHSMLGGLVLVVGGWLYRMKLKDNEGISKKTMALEVFAQIFIGLYILSGIAFGFWYTYPISYVVVPVVVIWCLLYAAKASRKARQQ